MQIGTFDTAPFEALGESIKKLHGPELKTFRKRCNRCLSQFQNIGPTPEQFMRTVEENRDLFDFLADALRLALHEEYKFKCGAQIASVAGSIKNAIARMHNGNAKHTDYTLCLSFADALKSMTETRLGVAA